VYDARSYADGRQYQGVRAVRHDLDGLKADDMVGVDGVDVEDPNKESGRGTLCSISQSLVAVI
jgi:UDP-N-acetylmuramyl tripeptide synthase